MVEKFRVLNKILEFKPVLANVFRLRSTFVDLTKFLGKIFFLGKTSIYPIMSLYFSPFNGHMVNQKFAFKEKIHTCFFFWGFSIFPFLNVATLLILKKYHHYTLLLQHCIRNALALIFCLTFSWREINHLILVRPTMISCEVVHIGKNRELHVVIFLLRLRCIYAHH